MLEVLADVVRRTRQHHAIEHATIHILGARHPTQGVSGYSDPLGFTIYGDIDQFELRRAVGDALLRLQAGERDLAIHPNCGTNLLATSVAATLAGISGAFLVRRGWLERFAVSLALTLTAVAASRPLGFRLQQYTTEPDVADRWVAEIRPLQIGSVRVLRVIFD
jgi:hypothetical protein